MEDNTMKRNSMEDNNMQDTSMRNNNNMEEEDISIGNNNWGDSIQEMIRFVKEITRMWKKSFRFI